MISFIGAVQNVANNGTSILLSAHASAREGDFELLAFMVGSDSTTLPDPGADWDLISAVTTTNGDLQVYYRYATTANLAANVSLTWTGSSYAGAIRAHYREVKRSSVDFAALDAITNDSDSATSGTSPATVTFPAVLTTEKNGSLVILVNTMMCVDGVGASGFANPNPTTGWNNRVTANPGASKGNLRLWDKVDVAAGTFPATTVDGSVSAGTVWLASVLSIIFPLPNRQSVL